MNFDKRLRRIDDKLEGGLGVQVICLETGEKWGMRENSSFSTASVIKTQIMAALFEQVKNKRLNLRERRRMRRVDIVEGSGVLKHMAPGVEMQLVDLCTLMMVISDNTATNMLIDRLGIERINETLRGWGFEKTILHRKITFDDTPSAKRGWLAETTPAETAELLARISNRKLLGKRHDEKMEQILLAQKYDTALPRRLPGAGMIDDDDSPLYPKVAHKTGSVDGVRNDAGIIIAPFGRFVVSAFTRKLKDNRYHPDNEGVKAIARVGRLAYDFIEDRARKAAEGADCGC